MIVVTGHKGFIGRNLVRRLEEQDYEVYGIDPKDLSDQFFMLERAPWLRVKRIFHLGAETSTTCTDVNWLFERNVKFSKKLFDYALSYEIPVHYASSAAIYEGRCSGVQNIGPRNQYGLSKLWVDMDAKRRASDLIRGYRFFNVYGKNEDKGSQSSVVWRFLEQARKDKVIKVFAGSENFYRDFIHVDDALDIFTDKTIGPGIWDVGTRVPENIMSIAETVAKHTGAGIHIIPFPKRLEGHYQTYTKAHYTLTKKNFVSVHQWIEKYAKELS